MALGTYTDLQAAIAAELARTDLAGVIPDFITRFEAKARRELRDWLRTTVAVTNVTGDYTLAGTTAEVLGVAYNDGANGSHNFPLDLVSRERYQGLLEMQPGTVNPPGQVCYVDTDVSAGTTVLRFWPPIAAGSPIANLKIEAVGYLPALSASQTTNALLRDAPDLYVAGSCAEAARYLQHDERVQGWRDEVTIGFRNLRIATERKLYSGAPRPQALARVF